MLRNEQQDSDDSQILPSIQQQKTQQFPSIPRQITIVSPEALPSFNTVLRNSAKQRLGMRFHLLLKQVQIKVPPRMIPGSWFTIFEKTANNRQFASRIAVNLLIVLTAALAIAVQIFHVAAAPVGPARSITTSSAQQQGFDNTHYTPAPLDATHPPPLLWAESAFLIDQTNGTILYSKNPDERLPMASTTKLMTAIVALQHASLNTMITVTSDAANTDCTCMTLYPGEKYSLHDLLYGMLMLSANDAAEAIADGLAGNVSAFAGWMNETARAIGMTNSHFMNPHGLDDPDHYSTSRDLATLARYALSSYTIHTMTTTLQYTIPATADHPKHDLVDLYQPMWWYPGADGGKPGWTGAARFIEILSAARDGHHLLGVIMRGANDWVTDIRSLLNWGFNDFTWVSPKDVNATHWIPFDDSYSHFAWDVPWRAIVVGGQYYYPYTGYIVAGPFLTYFLSRGGLSTFGYPTGEVNTQGAGISAEKFQNGTMLCNMGSGACWFI